MVIPPKARSPPANYFLWKGPKDAPFTSTIKNPLVNEVSVWLKRSVTAIISRPKWMAGEAVIE